MIESLIAKEKPLWKLNNTLKAIGEIINFIDKLLIDLDLSLFPHDFMTDLLDYSTIHPFELESQVFLYHFLLVYSFKS